MKKVKHKIITFKSIARNLWIEIYDDFTIKIGRILLYDPPQLKLKTDCKNITVSDILDTLNDGINEKYKYKEYDKTFTISEQAFGDKYSARDIVEYAQSLI